MTGVIKVFNFIKSKLDSLPSPSKGKVYYSDTKENGLKLYVTTKGAKSFCYRRKFKGKDYVKIFGNYPDLSIERARSLCSKAKAEIADGINIFEENSLNRKDKTFQNAIEEYIEEYSELHKKEKTVKEEKKYLALYLKKLSNRKLANITYEDIRKVHSEISKNNGKIIANRVIEFVRAMYNWKIDNGWQGSNPAKGIKFNKEKKKDRFLKKDEMKQFLKALELEHNEIARDFFYLCIYTAARRSNILAMRWEDIDFENKIWRIPETKNSEPLNVPLVKPAIKLLKNRKKQNILLKFDNIDFVLPSNGSKSGHLEEPKSAFKRILKQAKLTNITIHDLRRTTASYMTMSGANLQTVGKILGHKSPQATSIYARLDIDPAKIALETATNQMLL